MKSIFSSRQTFNFVQNWVPLFKRLLQGNRLFRGCELIIIRKVDEVFSIKIMPLLKNFDDKDGNGGGQKKSDDLRTMTTIGQRTLIIHCSVVKKIKSRARSASDLSSYN